MDKSSRKVAKALSLALLTNILGIGVLCQSSDAEVRITQTKNFIDTISGYSSLSSCASAVLSRIVRDENSGCQDSYAITSYTCFCTDSSAFMYSAISHDVLNSCPASVTSAQAASALGVFVAYCALGIDAGLAKQTPQGKSLGPGQ